MAAKKTEAVTKEAKEVKEAKKPKQESIKSTELEKRFVIDSDVLYDFVKKASINSDFPGIMLYFDEEGIHTNSITQDNVTYVAGHLGREAFEELHGGEFQIGIRDVELLLNTIKSLGEIISCVLTEDYLVMKKGADTISYRLAGSVESVFDKKPKFETPNVMNFQNSEILKFATLAQKMGATNISFEAKSGSLKIVGQSDVDVVEKKLPTKFNDVLCKYSLQKLVDVMSLFAGDEELQMKFTKSDETPMTIVYNEKEEHQNFLFVVSPRKNKGEDDE